MKKYIAAFVGVMVLGFISFGLINIDANAKNTPDCTAQAVGARSGAFAVAGNTATVKFTVSGAKGCTRQISANSFYAPSANGQPYSKQVLYQRVTKTYGPGTYSVSVALPPSSTAAKGCFYQVDLTYGTHNVTPVLAYGHGALNCGTTPPPAPAMLQVCDLATKSIVSIKETDFDASKYSKDLADCTVVNIQVCDLATKAIVTIDQKQFDASKYSQNLNDCQTPTPTTQNVCEKSTNKIVTINQSDFNDAQYSSNPDDCKAQPTTTVPAELPTTGPADVMMKLFGAASLAGAGAYYIASRRG